MPSRFEYERAVRASDLPPLSRLLALTIATWAEIKTGKIPQSLMPSLSTLEAATGMARASVRTHLDRLEKAGWVIRKRPTVAAARAEKARTRYLLRVPPGAAVADPETEISRAGAALEAVPSLGQEMPQTGAGDAPELGQEMTTARAGAALNSSFSSSAASQQQREAGTAAASFLEALPAPWTVGPRTATAMAPKLLEMTRRQGWALDGDLVAKLTEPGGQIRNHGQILRLRIEDLPRRAPQPAAKPTAPLPPWCGECADSNPAARLSGHLRKTYDEHGNAAPCPRCHPSHATNAA